MRLSSRHALVVLGALGVFFAAACGSDEPEDNDDSTSTTTGTPTSTTTSTGMGGTGGTGGATTTTSVGGTGGTGGVGGGGMGGTGGTGGGETSNAHAAYYWGDFTTDGASEVGAIDDNGAGMTLALMGFEGQTDIRSVALSPDGTKLAVSGKNMAGDASVINIYNADGSGNPITLVDATGATNTGAFFSRVSWSPDGTMLAYTANLEFNSGFVLYVVPADGSAPPKAVSPADADGQAVAYSVWVDNTHIAYNGDPVVNNEDCIWSVDVTQASPTPVELAPCSTFPSTSQDVNPLLVPAVDAMGRIYFAGDFHAGNQQFRIYRNTVDGLNFEQVPGTSITIMSAEATTPTFGVSPAGDKLAVAVLTASALYNVYVLDLAQTTASDVTMFTVPPASGTDGPDLGTNLWFSPDGATIAVKADWGAASSDQYSLFLVKSDGSAPPVRIASPVVTNGDVSEAVWSADGLSIFFRGDMLTDNDTELFGTTDLTTADQVTANLLIQGVPSEGDVFGLIAGK